MDGACGRDEVSWGAVCVLAVGPEAELSTSVEALGGQARASLGEASAVNDDGRLQVSASGFCLAEPGCPLLVFTSAAIFAPFFTREAVQSPLLKAPSNTSKVCCDGNCALQAIVDVGLVPSTEVFVLFEDDDKGSSAARGNITPARLVACFPLPVAEVAFEMIKHAMAAGGPGETMSEEHQLAAAGVVWLPPAVGSLGIAVLHVWPSSDLQTLTRGFQPLSPGAFARSWSGAQEGCSLRISATPFGALKPSIFMNTQTRGMVASRAAEGELLLLDARCLPGSEGGVVLLEPPSGFEDLRGPHEAGSSTLNRAEVRHAVDASTEQPQPLALLVPAVNLQDEQQFTMAAAVPLQSVGKALFTAGLPDAALQRLLGPKVSRAFGSSAGGCMAGGNAALYGELFRSLCLVSVLEENSASGVALKLSGHGHFLTSSRFALQATAHKQKAEFRCSVSAIEGPFDTPAPSGTVTHYVGQVLHMFEGLAGISLVSLRHEIRSSSSSPQSAWCRALDVQPLLGQHEPACPAMQNTGNSLQAGSKVWSLRLLSSIETEPMETMRPLLVEGLLSRVVTRSDEWRPSLLQCSFPAMDGVDSPSASVLVHCGPHAMFLGLPVTGAAWEAPDNIIPCMSLWASTFQLMPLFHCSDSDAPGQRMGKVALPSATSAENANSQWQQQLAGLDAHWKRRMALGRLHMVWQEEVESCHAPLRSADTVKSSSRA
eukprot:CAMPEP_0172745964 /NCGR_PEP_ID=MMETSP1074-20121228/139278_1 /TAXON_ID=2916 /ORGANISM="Ceratium fusus, Strain PA161109" /LENGTH=713 /DNA_ID=CAMNT_0013577231 /DNA_START=29 /DNA_END=2167 /DNA_ORIENTATION=+